jgi:hypothetical protein
MCAVRSGSKISPACRPRGGVSARSTDLFHDEDITYVERLRAADVPCEVEMVKGAFYGFDGIVPKAEVSQLFFNSRSAMLRRVLSRAAASRTLPANRSTMVVRSGLNVPSKCNKSDRCACGGPNQSVCTEITATERSARRRCGDRSATRPFAGAPSQVPRRGRVEH